MKNRLQYFADLILFFWIELERGARYKDRMRKGLGERVKANYYKAGPF